MNEILAKIRYELEAQPAPRTYEVARALSVLDDFESRPTAPALAPFEKLVDTFRVQAAADCQINHAVTRYSTAKYECADAVAAVVEEVRGK